MACSDTHSQPSPQEIQNFFNFAYVQGELILQPGTLKRARLEHGDEDEEDDVAGSDYSDEETDAPARKQRFEICEQCDKEYDVLHNEKRSCQWHAGELEVDYEGDFWADHDENCHGMIDTPGMREENPEGFVWTCCNKPGTELGCKQTRHQPNRAKRVKR